MNSALRGFLTLATMALIAAPAQADLRSFFHGDPPPVVKAPPPKQLAIVSTHADATHDAQVEAFLRALANAILARDGTPIVAHLSPLYTIEGMPDDMKASDLMVQAIAKIPGPTQMVIRSVEAKAGVRTASVEFHHESGKVNLKIFQFDEQGRLLASNLFRLGRG